MNNTWHDWLDKNEYIIDFPHIGMYKHINTGHRIALCDVANSNVLRHYFILDLHRHQQEYDMLFEMGLISISIILLVLHTIYCPTGICFRCLKDIYITDSNLYCNECLKD